MKKKIICEKKTTFYAYFNADDDNYYLKTHDVARYLSIKQPFEFNSSIKEIYGDENIISGESTTSFRTIFDNKKTTYINAKTLLMYLENIYTYNKHLYVNDKNRIKLINKLNKLTTSKTSKKTKIGTYITKVPVVLNPNDNNYYVRTHDIAEYLNISQPFELNARIKNTFGDMYIITGDEASYVRNKGEKKRVTFINVNVIDTFFNRKNISKLGIRYDKEKLQIFLTNLNNYLAGGKN